MLHSTQPGNLIIVTDTCTYLTPLIGDVSEPVMTDSGKWAWYAPGNGCAHFHNGTSGALMIGVSQAVKFAVQTLSVITLSRLLQPQDFGYAPVEAANKALG